MFCDASITFSFSCQVAEELYQQDILATHELKQTIFFQMLICWYVSFHLMILYKRVVHLLPETIEMDKRCRGRISSGHKQDIPPGGCMQISCWTLMLICSDSPVQDVIVIRRIPYTSNQFLCRRASWGKYHKVGSSIACAELREFLSSDEPYPL